MLILIGIATLVLDVILIIFMYNGAGKGSRQESLLSIYKPLSTTTIGNDICNGECKHCTNYDRCGLRDEVR